MKTTYPLYLANKPESPNQDLHVYDKYTGDLAATVAMASPSDIDRAIAAAVAARKPMEALPAYERQNVLNHCVGRFRERFDELAESLCIEAGKPIKDARGEVSRLIDRVRELVQTPGGD